MPHIQIAKKQYSESEISRALERELRTGIRLKQEIEHVRERAAAKEAATFRGSRTVKGFGRHIAEIPQWEYHNLVNKYGYAEVHSKGFMRYLQKAMPHLASAKV
jgi:hypothetical protein